MSDIKLKDLLKENFSGTLIGGVVSRSPFHDNISLSKIVKEKYGEVEEQEVDIKGLTTELSSYNKLGESIFGESNITKIAEKLSWIANQAKSHTLSETEDWFDKITVNRNMKELTGLSGQFGKIAKEWREENRDKKGNIRDYANVSQLVCLSNLENFNAFFIEEEMTQSERLVKLNKIAISQMKLLTKDHTMKKLALK